MYQTNFPGLTAEDFDRIVEEYRLMYGEDDEEETTNLKHYGKETDKEKF